MTLRLAMWLILLAFPGVGAAQGSAPEAEDAASSPFARLRQPETPESLYSKGLSQLKRGYYDEAILSFEKVRNHFPFNQYSVLAELRVADCLYEKAAYLEAVDAYRRFAKLHPRHPEIDYVVYRTARSEFKLAPVVAQRDQSPTRRALRRLSGFDTRFPDSEYLPSVQNLRRRALKRVTKGALQVGNFYWKAKEWKAAERRYRLAAEEFPDSPLEPKARYRQGVCLWRMEQPDEARAVLAGVLQADPEGRWGKRASGVLDRLGGPEVAEQESAAP